MSVQGVTALITAIGSLLVAITGLVHSIQTRKRMKP